MDAYVNAFTRFLFVQSWQVALLAVVIGVIVHLLRHKSAHVRYLLWLIVLVKCVVPPLYPVSVAVLPQASSEEWLVPFAAWDAKEISAADPEPSRTHTSVRSAETIVPDMSTPISTTRLSLTPAQITILIWLTGVCVFLLWIAGRALRYTLWLRPRRRLLAVEQQDAFRELLVGMRSNRLPRIYVTKEIGQPFVWGLFRGSVYLPERFSDLDDLEQCRAVLSHELSHVARFDAALNLLQVLVQAFYWFHPLVWWVNRKIRVEREKCCDEMVVAQLELPPENYTGAIVEALAQEKRSVTPIPSLAIVGSLRDIEERIKTMMKPGKRFYRRPSALVAMIVLALALITVPTALVLTVRAATESDIVPPHQPASGGDITAVEKWLAQGGDVNIRNKDGETLLKVALSNGRQDIIHLLQRHGADIDAEIQNDPSLIRWVATQGSHVVADELISRGADTSHVYVASYLGKLDQVKEYIESGQQQVSSFERNQILRGAITGGHTHIIEYILDHGANIKAWDILDIAVGANRKHILELLIAKGANPDPGGDWAPLHITLWHYPRLEMAKTLLSHGADPIKDKGEHAWNPMHYAIESERKDMVKLFLDHSRDKDLIPYAYHTMAENHKDLLPLFEPYVKISPIHLSCFYGKLNDVKSYLEQGKDIEAQDIGGLSLLHFAVVGCQMEIVDHLIAQGCHVNSRVSNGATALHLAANGNSMGKEMVQRLIDAGALVEAKDNNDETPFYYSVTGVSDDLETAEVLLKHGADINIQSQRDGDTALHDAARRAAMERVRWLIANGADVNRRRKDDRTPLSLAIQKRRLDTALYLLENGADIHTTTKDGKTFLHWVAGRQDNAEAVEWALEHGAKVNSKDSQGWTPFHLACGYGNMDIVNILMEKGADIHVKTDKGLTALDLACREEQEDVVQLLLNKGADIHAKTDNGSSLLHSACYGGHKDIVIMLIEKGADIHAKNGNGTTPLYGACQGGHKDIVIMLIGKGADIHAKNDRGSTPLHSACHGGHKDVVQLLLDKGAEINSLGYIGTTPLYWAARANHKDIVELLLTKGADITVQNTYGITATGRALERGHMGIVELLSNKAKQLDPPKEVMTIFDYAMLGDTEKIKALIVAGQDVNTKSKNGEVPLFWASTRGHRETAELLIQNGANVNIQSDRGRTPLLVASSYGNKEIVELLITNGAEIHVKDNEGNTALDLARKKEHTEIVELFKKHGGK